MVKKIGLLSRPKILNLFGYTGLASLILASSGAEVTHVDASKPAITWARENQELSGLGHKPIRWIVEDAMKFVERELNRRHQYDGIILDPPEFGRGPKGEVWRIEESLRDMIGSCVHLLSDRAVFLLLSVYATDLSPVTLYYLFKDALNNREGAVEIGELFSVEAKRKRAISKSLFVRWYKQV